MGAAPIASKRNETKDGELIIRLGGAGQGRQVAPSHRRERMRGRREFLKAGAMLSILPGVRASAAKGPPGAPDDRPPAPDESPAPVVAERLDQGPFGIEQDQGWYTIATT